MYYGLNACVMNEKPIITGAPKQQLTMAIKQIRIPEFNW